MINASKTVDTDSHVFELYVRGEIPKAVAGSLVVATNRRHKDRHIFSRWHDSQTDLMRLDLLPGKPGCVIANVLSVDPSGENLGEGFRQSDFDRMAYGRLPAYGYATQPNHGINIAEDTIWATNLLFGAPLEVDLLTWQPRRILRYVEPDESAPRVSSTSHFAWSLDHHYAYFHQSLLESEATGRTVRAVDLRLIELNVKTGVERTWKLLPPDEDNFPEAANFHSAFYYQEQGRRFVGLLRTGAVIEHIAPHVHPDEHHVVRMPSSTIWIVEIENEREALQAHLLPGIHELDGLALSHLDVDASGGNGFVLYANYKEADVAEETHGENLYGEKPEEVTEHYSGMIVEAINYGQVIRYEQRGGKYSLQTFKRPYDPGKTSLGHTWLPINIELDASRQRLFCSFSGFRPRLLPRRIVNAYPDKAVDPQSIRYVPPLLMRFNAATLEPEYSGRRDYLSYAEPIAMCVIGDAVSGYVCTFSPEIGLRIYRADDLSYMVGHAVSAQLWHWNDSHFRPDPAHLVFIPR
jgi:hypothetical protein